MQMEQSLGNFAGEISEYGDTNNGDFCGTTCSTAIGESEKMDSFFIRGQELLRKFQHRSKRPSLRGPLQRLASHWSANEAGKFCYTGTFHPDYKFYRFEKNVAEILENIAHRNKRQSGSVALAMKPDILKKCRKKLIFLWNP